MLKITRIENLIENYPFLQAIDKVKSVHGMEIQVGIGDYNERIETKHDIYQITLYDKEPIEEKDCEIQLTQILLTKLEREVRDTFYINFLKFCPDRSLIEDLTGVKPLSTKENLYNDEIILDVYKSNVSCFRGFTKLYIRQSFQNWHFTINASTTKIDRNTGLFFPDFRDVSKELQDSNVYALSIRGMFGLQKCVTGLKEKKPIHYTLLASEDLMGYVNEKSKYEESPYTYKNVN